MVHGVAWRVSGVECDWGRKVTNQGFVVIRCLKQSPEYFAGLHVSTGKPIWSDDVTKAEIWENRLHAESQALLLIRFGEVGTQKKAVWLNV